MATNNKYDRQLRLWGASGQKALYESIVVLVNATAAGTETLKNLILPGIGSFHIVDDQFVSPSSDPFSNFFVCPPDITSTNGGNLKSRAEVASVFLSELNADVAGRFSVVPSLSETDFSSLLSRIHQEHSCINDLNTGISSSNRRMFVIAADLPPTIFLKLSSACWNYGATVNSSIPLVMVRSYGLFGTVRIQVRYHPIIDSKPDNTVPDLRIINTQKKDDGSSCIFPTLRKFADQIHLDELDSQTHGHVPYVILLIKALDQWTANHMTGEMPKTMQEKESFGQIIKTLSRDFSKELNFDEAKKLSYLAYAEPRIPGEVQMLVERVVRFWESSIPFTSSFDILLLALHRFMLKSSHQPPIHGSIPDMTSNTELYIELQKIYKAKADEDRMLMKSLVDEILRDSKTTLSVSDDELALFCKNVNNLHLIQTRNLEDEYMGVYSNEEEKEQILGDISSSTCDPYADPEQTPLLWYIVLRACDLFYSETGKFPGDVFEGEELENDVKYMKAAVVRILEMLNLHQNEFILSTLGRSESFIREMIRFNNAEIHTIASLVAGVASQEAVKLITGQFVPIDGTYVFNGIASVAGVYKF